MHVIGMPLTEICNATYADPRQRQLFKNIIYVGALSVLLDIDADGDRRAFRRAVPAARSGCSTPTCRRCTWGATTSREHLSAAASACACAAPTRSATGSSSTATAPPRWAACTAAPRSAPGIRSRPRRRWPRPSRNTAASSASTRRPASNRYAIVQAEDEIASIGMVVGAGWNGARAFTATSGPGMSLMTEFIGLAYFAEIPVTIIDVQRGGPSTGMPTRTQQADILSLRLRLARRHQARAAASRRTRTNASSFAAAALDLADRLQTPVFVMTDLDIGMNQRLCRSPSPGTTSARYDRGKVMTAEELEAGQAISAATRTSTATASPGARCPARTRARAASSRAAPRATRTRAIPRRGPDYQLQHASGCCASSATAAALVPQPVLRAGGAPTRYRRDLFRLHQPGDARGAGRAASRQASTSMRCGCARFRFRRAVLEFIAAHDKVFVVEQNRDAQMRSLLVNELADRPGAADRAVLHYDGTPITARFIAGAITLHVEARAAARRRKEKRLNATRSQLRGLRLRPGGAP